MAKSVEENPAATPEIRGVWEGEFRQLPAADCEGDTPRNHRVGHELASSLEVPNRHSGDEQASPQESREKRDRPGVQNAERNGAEEPGAEPKHGFPGIMANRHRDREEKRNSY